MNPNRNYETLDALVVVASLVMVSGLLIGLILVKDIPQNSLPILASLGTAILGLPVSYGAFRWGNNVGAKKAQEDAAEATKATSAALAQLAGAGAPPPAAPLNGMTEQDTAGSTSPKG